MVSTKPNHVKEAFLYARAKEWRTETSIGNDDGVGAGGEHFAQIVEKLVVHMARAELPLVMRAGQNRYGAAKKWNGRRERPELALDLRPIEKHDGAALPLEEEVTEASIERDLFAMKSVIAEQSIDALDAVNALIDAPSLVPPGSSERAAGADGVVTVLLRCAARVAASTGRVFARGPLAAQNAQRAPME